MSNDVTIYADRRQQLVAEMSEAQGMTEADFYNEMRSSCLPAREQVSDQRLFTFLSIAKKYGLNPLMREIYYMPGQGGKWSAILGADGAYKLANSHPACNGITVKVDFEDGVAVSATATVHRKDWDNPVVVTEYMAECKRNTGPWKQYPLRMIKHKALMQAIRIAFGVNDAMDHDEWERHQDALSGRSGAPAEQQPQQPEQREERDITTTVNDADRLRVLEAIEKTDSIDALAELQQHLVQARNEGRLNLGDADMQIVREAFMARHGELTKAIEYQEDDA
ncbi:recombinase RecT [Ferrimonas balearica]|uniref:recombinase RecT n=1 Tax=Ferrimonas balearica TaxID=44012 RepID=UPI001C93A185|nr:recombinase RecT [Ferrimonas balearica]MBY6104980.1 recombinase RecT [Ferrimonas balearica]